MELLLKNPKIAIAKGNAARPGNEVRAFHMFSKSIIRVFVFPDRICRSVLNLSLPSLTFFMCSTSICDSLPLSLALSSSAPRDYKHPTDGR